MSPERKLELELVKLAKAEGWFCRKLKWIGRNGAPDRLLITPAGKLHWVELKSPGQKPSAIQRLEHRELERFHQLVRVVDNITDLKRIFK